MSLDLSGAIKQKIDDLTAKAKAAEKSAHFPKAAELYRKVAEAYVEYARATKIAEVRKKRTEAAKLYLEKSKQVEAKKAEAAKCGRAVASSEKEALTSQQEEIRRQVLPLITKIPVTWDDIGGLGEVKTEMRMLYGIALGSQPSGVKIRQNTNVLLFGPPGTGKTLLAAALSNTLEATFFAANARELVSKWLGESSKLVGALFDEARVRAPSVVFVDEFDSLAPSRDEGLGAADTRILGSFLTEMDGLKSKATPQKTVFCVAATNKPWKLDDAVLSRFAGGLVHVPLPDAGARSQILNLNLGASGLKTELDEAELLAMTQGLSGRETVQFCNLAVRSMLRRANPDLGQKVDEGLEAVRRYNLRVAKVARTDLELARARIKPATGTSALARYERWYSDRK
jgi:katanin p60 ATPase-containing subunit A1